MPRAKPACQFWRAGLRKSVSELFRSQEAHLEDFQASRMGLDRPFSDARVGPTISEDSRAPLRYSQTKNQRVSGRGVLAHDLSVIAQKTLGIRTRIFPVKASSGPLEGSRQRPARTSHEGHADFVGACADTCNVLVHEGGGAIQTKGLVELWNTNTRLGSNPSLKHEGAGSARVRQ
jgi:hypothetical protein